MPDRGLQFAVEACIREAHKRNHEYITPEHLLYALLFEDVASRIIAACGGDLDEMRDELESFFDTKVPKLPGDSPQDAKQTLGFRRVLENAIHHVRSAEKQNLDGGDVLVSLYAEPDSFARYVLEKQGITKLMMTEFISDDELESDETPVAAPMRGPSLSKLTVNLTEQARLGNLDPLIGREQELGRVMQVLCRRTKNNPVLIGDAGVGKTAIIEGLAQRIVAGSVPEILQDAEIFTLDLGALLAGTKFRGQFEERMKGVLDALKKKPNPILFIDDIHMIAGAGSASGSSMDVSNLLKPALQEGHVRCVGATTHEDFRRHLENDRALVRRLQKIDIGEPSVADTIKILDGLREKYETFHRVSFTHEALESAAELSSRHITERFLPDKAIDVLDETGAANQMRPVGERASSLDAPEVQQVVARIARIPELKAQQSERDRLSVLASRLRDVVFGQDFAIESVVNAITLARAGLGQPDQPVGSFLFVGPTGVGKTEVAKQLAQVLGIAFLRYDMSEYMEKHTVSRLIGAPPGYVGYDQGGLLTEAVRKQPHCVLLLDEIEKAHMDLFDILLQVMDRATLTDNNGKEADFRNVILIMTSNAGARDLSRREIGFERDIDVTRGKKEIERLFSPEFRNRLTDTVTFHRLPPAVVEKIVDKFVAQLQEQLTEKHVTLTLQPAARVWLAEHGYDEVFGARPLLRLIQKKIRQPLAAELLFGRLQGGGTVFVHATSDGLSLTY